MGKNKKLILTLVAYTSILLLLIVGLVTVMQMKTQNDFVEVYVALQDIEQGTATTDEFANSIKKQKVAKTTVDDMKKNGATVITSMRDFKSQALSFIPQGTIFSTSMFGDVQSLDIMETYKNAPFNFLEPYYSVFKVDNTNTPASGFEERQPISIEGTVKLENTSYDKDLEEDSKETFNGILSNKCVVHSLFYNADGVLENIGVMVEKEDYSTINYFASNGTIKFHDGKIENKWGTTNASIMKELWEKSGFKSGVAEALKTYAKIYKQKTATESGTVESLNESVSDTKVTLCDYNDLEFSNEMLPTMKFLKLDNNAFSYLQIYTPYKEFSISHYKLNGEEGEKMDIDGVNTVKNYDSKTGLYNFILNEEGYYEIRFFGIGKVGKKIDEETTIYEDSKDEILLNKIIFIVEKETSESWNGKLTLGYTLQKDLTQTTPSETLTYDLGGVIQKSYFKDLAEYVSLGQMNLTFNDNLSILSDTYQEYFNSYSLGSFGSYKIKGINLKFGEEIFPLYHEYGNYEAITEENKVNTCYYLGLRYDDVDKRIWDYLTNER